MFIITTISLAQEILSTPLKLKLENVITLLILASYALMDALLHATVILMNSTIVLAALSLRTNLLSMLLMVLMSLELIMTLEIAQEVEPLVSQLLEVAHQVLLPLLSLVLTPKVLRFKQPNSPQISPPFLAHTPAYLPHLPVSLPTQVILLRLLPYLRQSQASQALPREEAALMLFPWPHLWSYFYVQFFLSNFT